MCLLLSRSVYLQAQLPALSKSDIGVLFTKVASAAARLQFLHLLVFPTTKSKNTDPANTRREPNFKSKEYAATLQDLAMRTSGGKVCAAQAAPQSTPQAHSSPTTHTLIRTQVERMVKTSVQHLFSVAEALEELTFSMPLPHYLFKALVQGIGNMQHLHSLSLRGSRLADAKCADLCAVLCECRALRVLDLAGCCLTDTGSTAVAALVKHRANKCATAIYFSPLSVSALEYVPPRL